jgi:hypothetical protein
MATVKKEPIILEDSMSSKLKKLFSTQSVIHLVSKGKLKVIDSSHIQSSGNRNLSVRPYSGVYSSGGKQGQMSGNLGWENHIYFRQRLFADYEAMESDPIINSALNIYGEECSLKNEFGDNITVKSDSKEIKAILENLFYDILNVEFNLFPWIRTMCKYGDCFLKIDLNEEIGIIGITQMSPYEIVREDYHGDNTRSPQFKYLPLDGSGLTDNIVFEYAEMAHFRLGGDPNFLPYGKSILEGGRAAWKRLSLAEEAMLLHRIMRAPERRIFKIDVGGLPPQDVEAYMQKSRDQIRKTPYIDPTTGEYNLKYNIENMLEDYFLPSRGGNTGMEIETLPGMDNFSIEDVIYYRDKMLAAFSIPRAFLGYEESLNGKSTLAQEDIRFARTVERIQLHVISELSRLANIHLALQGFKGKELANFEISLTGPSIIYQQEKMTFLSDKLEFAEKAKESGILPMSWIYSNIFDFTEEEVEAIRRVTIEDAKHNYRLEQINNSGEDPASVMGNSQEDDEMQAEDELEFITDEEEDSESDNDSENDNENDNTNNEDKEPRDNDLADDPLGRDGLKAGSLRG